MSIFLEDKCLITDRQSGFRKKQSYITALIDVGDIRMDLDDDRLTFLILLQPVHRTFFWVIRTPNGKRFLLLVSVHFFLSANKKSSFFTEKFGSTNSNTSKTSCQIRRSNNSNRRVAIIIKNGWKWISLPKNCKKIAVYGIIKNYLHTYIKISTF